MCTPSLAIDLVIQESGTSDRIWLVTRKDTNQLAVMGGFVNVGESVEHAVARELFEEMGIRLEESPRLLGIYSDPRRDNRRHTVSAVFVVKVDDDIKPKAADDVKDVQRIRLNEIEDYEYFADHKSILDDYRRSLKGNDSEGQSPINDAVENIVRSTCSDHSLNIKF
jgi:8-oxo-dGTP diphosphatase